MQLWKKNFLVTFFLFLIVIYASLLVLYTVLFRSELSQWISRAVDSEQGFIKLISNLQNEDSLQAGDSIGDAVREYISSETRVSVEINGEMIADYSPFSGKGGERVSIVQYQKVPYILINDCRENAGIEVTYMESMAAFYKNQKWRAWMLQLLGILSSAVIGVMLYLTMKRINRPVSQIAHELRTPLTGIQGYAQYLMMGNLSEEDRFFAARQIVDSSRNLGSIVEKLLIMGGMKEGRVQRQKVDIRQILEDIKELYPGIEIECRTDYIQGDKTLIRCLLGNLVHNAVNSGKNVKVYADSAHMTVSNDGQPIGEKKLKQMNKTQGLSSRYADRHGLGIGLCHEIAGVHGWKLIYRSSEEETTAEIIKKYS